MDESEQKFEKFPSMAPAKDRVEVFQRTRKMVGLEQETRVQQQRIIVKPLIRRRCPSGYIEPPSIPPSSCLQPSTRLSSPLIPLSSTLHNPESCTEVEARYASNISLSLPLPTFRTTCIQSV